MKNIILIRPKTIEQIGFCYGGFEDLPALIKFVGSAPTINIDLTLNFKKVNVKIHDIVFRNYFGEVTHTTTEDKLNEGYEIVNTLDYAPEYDNKVTPKVKVIKEGQTGKKAVAEKKTAAVKK